MLYTQQSYFHVGMFCFASFGSHSCTLSHFALNMRTKQALLFKDIKKCLNFLSESSVRSPHVTGSCAGVCSNLIMVYLEDDQRICWEP